LVQPKHDMRTFLRHIATGQYFQSLERWTPDRDDAYDFGIISKAMKVAHKIRIPDLELVLSLDDPDEVAATPFEKLLHGLLHTGKRHVAGRRASRPWRAALSN
jgi:hypothetical protein